MEQNETKLLDIPSDLLRTILGFVADITVIRCRTMQELKREYSFIFVTMKFFLVFGRSIRSLDLEYPSEEDIHSAWEYSDTIHNVDYLKYVFNIIKMSSGLGLKSLKLPLMTGWYLENILHQLKPMSSKFPNIRSLNIPGTDHVNNDIFQMVSELSGLEELVVRDATESNLHSLTNATFRLRYFSIIDYSYPLYRARGLIIGNLLRFTMGAVDIIMLRFFVDEFSEERINGDDATENLLKYIDSIVSEGKVSWNGLGIDLISNFYIPEELVHGDVLIPMKRICDMVSVQRKTRDKNIARSKLKVLKITFKYPKYFLEDGINAVKSCISNIKCILEIITPVLGVKWNTEEASYNIVGLLIAKEFVSFVLEEAKSTDFSSTVSLPKHLEGAELKQILNIFSDQTISSFDQSVADLLTHTDDEFPLHYTFFLYVLKRYHYATTFEVSRESISESYWDSYTGRKWNHLSNVEKILITSRPIQPLLPIEDMLRMQESFFESLPCFLRKMASCSSRLKCIILQPCQFPFDSWWHGIPPVKRTISKMVLSFAFAECTAGLDIFRRLNPSIEIRTIYREVLVWSQFNLT